MAKAQGGISAAMRGVVPVENSPRRGWRGGQSASAECEGNGVMSHEGQGLGRRQPYLVDQGTRKKEQGTKMKRAMLVVQRGAGRTRGTNGIDPGLVAFHAGICCGQVGEIHQQGLESIK